jgi:glycogen debranching enzyme
VERHLSRLRPRFDTQYVSQGRTVLAVGLDGTVAAGSPHGLFVHETRLISRLRYTLDGRPPYPVVACNAAQHTWLGYYIALPPGLEVEQDTGSGQVDAASQHTIELRVSRYVGEGVHEDLDFTNYSQRPASFAFAVEADGDFADYEEVKGRRQHSGQLDRTWRRTRDGFELSLRYEAAHRYDVQGNRGVARITRAVTVRVVRSDTEPRSADGAIVFDVQLAPRARWHACVEFVPEIDGTRLPVHRCGSFEAADDEYDRRRGMFLDEATRFTAPGAHGLLPVVVAALDQAKRDLAALRLYDLDHGPHAWTMAAGLPIYVALFGRDTLTAAWQSALAGPGAMVGTLHELQRWQGREVNDWRDEQPGRMLHEAHTGPLEMLNMNPRSRYYGSITTSAFFPVVVAELWHWTGDRALVAPLVRSALRALAWLDRHGDVDGDGFYEYQTRSTQGVRHQAWKDSGDAIVDEDGSDVKPPIATCEEQGFVYIGKLLLGEVLWWLGERGEARRLIREAGELKRRFNDTFWLPYEGFFALGLGPDKRPIRSITSNPGHCLATGIVDKALAAATADRLIAPDLFSGWGIRTLSAEHPAYNPYSYHRGSVWPVEHGTFTLGCMRYGLWDHVALIARSQFEAATLFDFYRLPEVFSGHPRDRDHPFPALYPQANSPQAWSASAIFCLLQSMLGLYPYAPLRLLLVDPHLPDWLPEITLENLRVGDASVTVRFFRTATGTTDYRIIDKRGRLHVARQPSPWSLTASVGERLVDLFTSLLPGR